MWSPAWNKSHHCTPNFWLKFVSDFCSLCWSWKQQPLLENNLLSGQIIQHRKLQSVHFSGYPTLVFHTCTLKTKYRAPIQLFQFLKQLVLSNATNFLSSVLSNVKVSPSSGCRAVDLDQTGSMFWQQHCINIILKTNTIQNHCLSVLYFYRNVHTPYRSISYAPLLTNYSQSIPTKQIIAWHFKYAKLYRRKSLKEILKL
jgi:hypothetical protein